MLLYGFVQDLGAVLLMSATAAASTCGPAPLGRSRPHLVPGNGAASKIPPGPGWKPPPRPDRTPPSVRWTSSIVRPCFIRAFRTNRLVAELVGDGFGAGHLGQDILDGPGVSPGQQLVEVADLGVELVVFFRTDGDDRVRYSRPSRSRRYPGSGCPRGFCCP